MKFRFLTVLCVLISNLAFTQKMMAFTKAQIPEPKLIDSEVSNFNQSQAEYKKLSTLEQEFYYWINYSRKNPHIFFDSVILPIMRVYPQLKGINSNSLKLDLSNSPQLSMLTLNEVLILMARNHSTDITKHNETPSHTSTNGKTFMERFQQNNLKRCGAENISYGSGYPIFLIALLYLDINIPDLGHRKTLLNPNFTETGLGVSFYKDGNIFLVEDFACTQN